MKSKSLILLPLVLLLMCVTITSCRQNTPYTYGGMKGKPISVMEKVYEVDIIFGEIIRNNKINDATKYYFDNNGKMNKISSYSSRGQVERETLLEYDSEGIVIKSETYSFGYKEKKIVEEFLLLNKSSKKREFITHSKWLGSNEIDTLKVDIIDNQTEKQENSSHITTIKYNKDKQVIEFSTISKKNNEQTAQGFYKYDKGLQVEWIEMLPMNPDRGQIIHKYEYIKFDDNKNWIEKVEYEDGEAIYITIREIEY